MKDDTKALPCLLAKVAIVRPNRDDYDIYSFDEIAELSLSTDDYHKCRFIDVGKKLKLENKIYEIKKISFRINPIGESPSQNFDIYSDEPDFFNCTTLVFVEEV